MLRSPSRRFSRRPSQGLNLIPILDAVFIFIFFLLMSTNFIQIFEISSDAPIISSEPPKESDKDPLLLSLKIEKDQLSLTKGLQGNVVQTFSRDAKGSYPLEELHQTLISLKEKNLSERQIILEPNFDIVYEELVDIMDSVRTIRNTDPSLTYKNEKTNEDIKVSLLFDQILFGNIQGDIQ